jgi:DNA-binding transcriptional ArsR family regulator
MLAVVEDTVWAALADPRRRLLLSLLRERPRSVGELVSLSGQSQPTTSKHLRSLRDAGLVHVDRAGQRRIYSVAVAPLVALDAWLAPYRPLWRPAHPRPFAGSGT